MHSMRVDRLFQSALFSLAVGVCLAETTGPIVAILGSNADVSCDTLQKGFGTGTGSCFANVYELWLRQVSALIMKYGCISSLTGFAGRGTGCWHSPRSV